MSMFGGGDDALIRKLYIVSTVFIVLFILSLILSGVIQVNPQLKVVHECTITYHPIVTTRIISINEPLIPRECSYDR